MSVFFKWLVIRLKPLDVSSHYIDPINNGEVFQFVAVSVAVSCLERNLNRFFKTTATVDCYCWLGYCVVVWVLFSSNLYYRTLFSDRIIGNLKKLPDFSISQVGKILLQVVLFTKSAEHLWVYM